MMNSERDRFALAIGRFIFEFSITELQLYEFLKNITGLNDAVARAIFSGTKSKGMIEYINSIIENTGIPERKTKQFKAYAGQLATLNTMRDLLVHYSYGWTVEKRMGATTGFRISRYKNSKTHWITCEEIDAMTADLTTIAFYLVHQAKMIDNLWEDYPFGLPTWLYKFPQPENQKGKSPQKSPKEKRQPKPSRK